MKKRNYLIGNAHLDPVWQWRWQEGYSEAKATFASALARMREFDDFIFTCAGASVYSWVEESAPDMFEEIKERVREGRWVIVGGMWVQPDCNLPSGESFARQCLYSQRYFKEKFGVTADVAYNVDSFGHNYNLPQLIIKGGMKRYVFMRPMKHEKEIESNTFYWQGRDGSKVLSFRIPKAYCCNFTNLKDMKEWFDDSCGEQEEKLQSSMLFYGVGNHGGGPTVTNLKLAHELDTEDEKIIFASPKEYFDDVEASGAELNTLDDELQHHASGCYSAVSEVKRLNRKCEEALMSAEKAAFLAEKLIGAAPERDAIGEAWRNVLFCQFHDSLGGCSTRDVYPDIYAMQNESLSRADKIKNMALQRIGWRVDTSFAENETSPIIVFNPNAWEAEGVLRVNRQVDGVYDSDGNKLLSQKVFSQTSVCTGRNDTIFNAKLPPMGYKCYYLKNTDTAQDAETKVAAGENEITNGIVTLRADIQSGITVSDAKSGKILLSSGAKAIIYDEAKHDTWSHALNFFNEKVGEFAFTEVKVTEAGPLRASLTLKAVNVTEEGEKSHIEQIFCLSDGSPLITVETTLDIREKHKAIKLEFPTGIEKPRAFYEIPYAHMERPTDGEEEACLNWVAVCGDGRTSAIYNDGKYSASVEGSVLRLMASRTPIYGDHGGKRDERLCYTDNGRQTFNYVIALKEGEDNFAEMAREAASLNSGFDYIFESIHAGMLPPVYSGANCGSPDVLISVVKDSEDCEGVVVRACERSGREVDAEINIMSARVGAMFHFKPYEIKTLYFGKDGVTERLFSEY